MPDPPRPTCWRCGYDLTGLRVEGSCPECGVSILPGPMIPTPAMHAQNAMVWGAASLAIVLLCPFGVTGVVALVPLWYARRAREAVAAGRASREQIRAAAVGRVLAWAAIVVSVGILGLYALGFVGYP